MKGSEPKWISNGNQDMIASLGISKQSQGNRLEIKHKMHTNKPRFYKNMQKLLTLAFRHQNRIPVYTGNRMELYGNERTGSLCVIPFKTPPLCFSFFLTQLSLPAALSLSLWNPASIPQLPLLFLFPSAFNFSPSKTNKKAASSLTASPLQRISPPNCSLLRVVQKNHHH